MNKNFPLYSSIPNLTLVHSQIHLQLEFNTSMTMSGTNVDIN